MKIAVIGSGAIGGLVAGYLKLKGADVTLTARAEAAKAINSSGFKITGIRGEFKVSVPAEERLSERPELAIVTTKTQDIEEALKDNLKYIKDSVVLTTQNGLAADDIAAKFLSKEKIVSSIVMFGSTYLEAGQVIHNFEGNWIIGSAFPGYKLDLAALSAVLGKAFPVVLSENIRGMKYLKLFVNANNCISAILGVSMQEAFRDIEVSRISINIWKEGLSAISKAGIKLVSLPDFPLERLTKLTSIPSLEAAKIYSGIMAGLSKEPLYGSILQSIKRGKASEINYINGEFVKIAQDSGTNAPLNEKLVQMVHQVEKTGKFFSKEELINSTKQFIS
ncbi:MAG: ketopantoate reductase family protein [Candidatus Omnitrophota bacterium]|jgi:2-dehydropantoate 2-reductase